MAVLLVGTCAPELAGNIDRLQSAAASNASSFIVFSVNGGHQELTYSLQLEMQHRKMTHQCDTERPNCKPIGKEKWCSAARAWQCGRIKAQKRRPLKPPRRPNK